ncbi:patatin-like phospholipase family protein [Photobacterium sp. CCB-ST2H9]|uniref:patatin-like phospholipase family protein n=1 Tax=unclassified Photobacterium TaxID=2628852 RepID=UPI002004B7EF|nr:patatin-like phospholipase family protein [Photobacterium sp. CCB-ST2H9]UTM58849.1 patatin-like phospholipase family protein [Photobacterium sp. CCB-ST2H9]
MVFQKRMLRFFALFLVISAVFPSTLVLAEQKNAERIKVGLVLGGGGAKGAAHVGVLKALEEMQIPVDYIVGTSMGAYVGGLYASGMSADEIEAILNTVDWASGYEDRVKRSERRVREKQQEDRFQIITDFGFSFWEIKVPRGFVQGQTMGEILRTTSGNLPWMASFDELPIPYRAVATDIEHLKPVVLSGGDLAESMQASMSVPGLLPPVKLDGKLLVDGGITNNLPISVVKAMGADVVIAVDISNDFKTADELTDYLVVMDQLTDFMVRDNAARQESLLQDADFLLRPDIQGITTTDFDRMPEAFDSGYHTVQAQRFQLSALGSATIYQDYIEKKQAARRQLEFLEEGRIDEIKLINNSDYADAVLLDRLQLKPGMKVNTEKLEKSVRDLYALDRFERVDYRIVRRNDRHILILEVKAKSWGPNFIDMRFALEDDFANNTDYSIGLALTATGLSEKGAEWRNELEYGSDKRIASELYVPFTSDQEWFSVLGMAYDVTNTHVTVSGEEPDLRKIDDFLAARFSDVSIDSSIGWQPALWQEFRLGYLFGNGETEFPGILQLGREKRSSRRIYLRYNLDTLDDFTLPKDGHYFLAEVASSDDSVRYKGEKFSDSSLHFDIGWKGAYTFGRHTVMGKAEYGKVRSDADLRLDPKELGGFLNLSGIPKNSLSGNNKLFSALVYRYHLMDNDFGLFNSSIYLGGSVEWGGVYNNPDLSASEIPGYYAGSIFTGITTPFGPFILAYGQTEEDLSSFYLFFGGEL